MRTIVLNNGIQCVLHDMPNTHSVTIGLYIKAGAGYIEPMNGITHLLEHLHFRQMGNMTQSDLYYRMESIGSTLRAVTYRDLLKFSMKMAPNYFEQAMGIFADLIDASQWNADGFEQEKKVIINQIMENGNYTSIDNEVRACVFKNHPLSNDIMGSPEDVEAIQLKDAINYKKTIFSPENVIICITGCFTPEHINKMKSILQKCTLSASQYAPKMEYPAAFHGRKPDIVLKSINDPNPVDVNISFDIHFHEDDYTHLMLLNCILGEGVGSRLQKCIREEKCYCSTIGSYIEWYYNFAILHIQFAVEKEKLNSCMEDVISVIQNLKSRIKEEDLAVSLPFYTTNYAFYEDDTEEMNFQIAYHRLCLNRTFQMSSISNCKHTSEKLETMAKSVFQEKNCCVVMVGNTKGITPKSIKQVLNMLKSGE